MKISPKSIFVILLFLGLAWFLYTNFKGPLNEKNSVVEKIQEKLNEATVQPFDDLRIPFLRQKTYQSSLGELRRVSQNSLYTSYLTTYSSEDLTINALLTRPTGEMPAGGWPAIVFVHGYIPPTLYKTQEKYVAYVDYLARNGFVVFKIDLRGHGSSEGISTGAYYSSGYVIDTLNAYAALQSAEFVNSKNIGLWGHSMAGNVSLRSLATKPEIPAAVIWAGAGFSYEDLRKYRINDQSYRPPATPRASTSAQLFSLRGQFSPDSAFWKEVAPTNYLTDLKGAIALHHAVNDDVVSIEYSRDLNQKLSSTTIPHEFYEYPNGGHNITDPSFSTAMKRTVDFFKKYLNN